MLGDPVGVLGGLVGPQRLAVGGDHAHPAVVEVGPLPVVDQAHVVRAVGVGLAGEQLAVRRVVQHDLVEELEAALGELDRPATDPLDLRALRLGDRLGHAARDGGHRVDAAAADDLDHPVARATRLDDPPADLQPDLPHHAQDAPLGDRGIRSDDEVGAPERVEVRGVVGEVEPAVEQLAEQARRPGRRDVVDGVRRLGRRHVVRLRAHAADAVGEDRHLLHRPAHAEPLEAAQLRDLEVRVGDVATLVQEDLDLAVTLEAGDRVDGDALHGGRPAPRHCLPSSAHAARPARSSDFARLKR